MWWFKKKKAKKIKYESKVPEFVGRNNPEDRNDWVTPQWFFDYFNERFNFTLDAAATKSDAKCEKYFTPNDDGLAQSWKHETVWLNPPYGRNMSHWIRKCYYESARSTSMLKERSNIIVCLMPARTCTRYFHDYVMKGANTIYIIKGRLAFEKPDGTVQREAPFPLLVVVFCPWPNKGAPVIESLDLKDIKATGEKSEK